MIYINNVRYKAMVGESEVSILNNISSDYIPFKDKDLFKICCYNWGDYNQISVTDNGDNTVNITTTLKSKLNTTVVSSKIIKSLTNVNNTNATYTAGTKYEPVGITPTQCQAVSTVDILNFSQRKLVTLTTNFSKTTPIYGIEFNTSNTKKADCYVNFDFNENHYIRIYLYHGYYGYVDGGSGYTGISSEWRRLVGTNKYMALLPNVSRFSTYMTLPYVTFRSINGYKPEGYNKCTLRVII